MGHKNGNSYREIGKALKQFGLIDYDLRRNLNSGQKSQISKLAAEYKQLISKPEAFKAIRVGKESIEGLKTAGYKVGKKGKAFIPLHDYQSVKLKDGRLLYRGGPGGREEDVSLSGSKSFFRDLEKLAGKRLGRNEMISVSINGAQHFSKKFKTTRELFDYLRGWNPKDQGANRDQLFARMSIVRVNDPGAFKRAPSRDKKNTESRSQRKRRAKKKP